MKRISLFLLVGAVAVMPLVPGIAAGDAPVWSELSAETVWEYDGYRVELLDETSTNVKTFGNVVLLDKPAASCHDCDLRDLTVMKNGGSFTIEDVPARAVDATQFEMNGNRMVYAELTGNPSGYVRVVEVDLETGLKTELVQNTFVAHAEEVHANVYGDQVYVTAYFTSLDERRESELYAYSAAQHGFVRLHDSYVRHFEEIQDLTDESALVKLTFQDGQEELWRYVYDGVSAPHVTGLMGTWTAAHEDILAAHYTDTDSIDFFRMYQRYTTDSFYTEPAATEDYLSWFRMEAPQVVEDTMAWVNPEDELWVSHGAKSFHIETIGDTGWFTMYEDEILWAKNDGTGGLSSFDGIQKSIWNFQPTDKIGDTVVGLTLAGDIVYVNTQSQNQILLGYGGAPFMTDARHVYWEGEDTRLYEATVFLSDSLDTLVGTPVKTHQSPEVYMLTSDKRSYIPSEKVFYTWFPSFAVVETVSEAGLNAYQAGSDLGFKPGTRVQIDGGAKVYVVGDDGDLHWIVTQAVAEDVYGKDWNQNLVQVSALEVLTYGYGADITSENDLSQIVMIATVN